MMEDDEMTPTVKALVKPELLVWAREDAGYSLDDAAKKVQVTPERLASWEQGSAHPTVVQLRKLARVYKRPIAVFYLPKPPKKFQAMHDYRRLSVEVAGHESPELRFAIKRAHFRRQVALELCELLDVEPASFSASARLSEDAEDVAARTRSILGLRLEEQHKWKSAYEAVNGWRTSLERLGILVFQVQDVDVAEMRGFSISGSLLPAVAVNIKDTVKGRIFSMLHELCHLMLNQEGLCDFEEMELRGQQEQKIEIFCNRVAGALMIPRGELLNEPTVKTHGTSRAWDESEIVVLARRFWASREVVVRRLLILGLTDESFYRRKREQYRREYELRGEAEGGFAPQHVLALSKAGTLFTRLVLDNYHRENITSGDLSEYLDINLKHVPKVEAMMLSRPAGGLG